LTFSPLKLDLQHQERRVRDMKKRTDAVFGSEKEKAGKKLMQVAWRI
jgi:hypothetical protein